MTRIFSWHPRATFAILCAILLPSAVDATVHLDELASLAGVTGFHVIAEDVVDQAAGFSKEGIETDVELQLRKAKLPLIIPSTPEQNATNLHISITILRRPVGYIYSIVLNFYQPVTIPRLNNLMIASSTWSRSGVGTFTDPAFLSRDITEKVKAFINDFQKAQSLAPAKPKDVFDDLVDKPAGGGLVFPNGAPPAPSDNYGAIWVALEKQYPGVDIHAAWDAALADATKDIGADNPKLRDLASKYFHERCKAATAAKQQPATPAP